MDFLRSLKARGLDGTKLVISDARSGLRAAIERVFEDEGVQRLIQWINCSRNGQRCRVHWMRNALAHVSRGQHTLVAAAIPQAFDQPDRASLGETWRKVADQLRPQWPKLAALLDESENHVLAYMGLPRQHRAKLHSTNPCELLSKELKRRTDVVGFVRKTPPWGLFWPSSLPNEASITRLIGAVLFEQNDEWQTASRYMMVFSGLRGPTGATPTSRFTQIDNEETAPILSIKAA